MDSTHRELFKNQKIIKIGSREKKLQLFKVGDFSKIFESPGFSYSKSEILLQKLLGFATNPKFVFDYTPSVLRVIT